VRIALLAGFGVAQIEEFSFVLGRQGADLDCSPQGARVFFAASVVRCSSPLALFSPGLPPASARRPPSPRCGDIRHWPCQPTSPIRR
jgi:hypothetical protein